MNEDPDKPHCDKCPDLADQVSAKVKRKLKARRSSSSEVWFGLGMMGVIGWSVTVPTLLGVALGVWLDRHHSGAHSWTLALLAAGLTIGCANAWHWVTKEEKSMHEDQEEDGDE